MLLRIKQFLGRSISVIAAAEKVGASFKGEESLMRLRLAVGLVVAFVVALSAVGSAQGDPLNDNSITVTLYNCSGPAGTPSIIQGTKILNSGDSLNLVDGTGVFVRTSLFDTVTGAFVTWGLQNNDRPRLTCNVVSGITGHLLVVSGFIAPMGYGAA